MSSTISGSFSWATVDEKLSKMKGKITIFDFENSLRIQDDFCCSRRIVYYR